jgi:ribokinase
VVSVLVFGSINMDLTTYVPRLPQPGETLFGHSFITVPGGKGNNQAVACAKLGAPTRLVGRVGNDAFGRAVLPLIHQQGVDTTGVQVDKKHGTGLAVINVDDAAENSIIVISGANMALNHRDVIRCAAAMRSVKVLMLQLEVPVKANLAAAKSAKEFGVTVIFDPAPATALPAEIYPLIDIITPNETETEVLVGIRPTTEAEAAKAASELRRRGVKSAIIKMGGHGVYFQSSDPSGGSESSGFVPPFPVKAVDTVAAGDAFNGGLAVALSEGHTLEEAIRWGAAAGALACTKPGASTSMPNRVELEALLKEGARA